MRRSLCFFIVWISATAAQAQSITERAGTSQLLVSLTGPPAANLQIAEQRLLRVPDHARWGYAVNP